MTPDDLLQDFHSSMDFFRFANPRLRLKKLESAIGHAAYLKLLELAKLIEHNPYMLQKYTHRNRRSLIRNDPVWARIRTAAGEVLREMSFDLQRWEKDHV